MIPGGRRPPVLLFLGDLAVFALSLWLTLLVRYVEIPSHETLVEHLRPFSFLFALWLLVFYMFGLYGKSVLLMKTRLPQAILTTQSANIVLAALFFFLVPGVGIAPKTNLIIYLFISLALIFAWRLALYPQASMRRERLPAIMIASHDEVGELIEEVNHNPRYHLAFAAHVTPEQLSDKVIAAWTARFGNSSPYIVADLSTEAVRVRLPQLYALSGDGQRLVEFTDLYEEVFDRVPLSRIQEAWFLKNVSRPHVLYSVIKRSIDIAGALAMGLVTISATPLIWIANRFDCPGPVFITQIRLGEGGRRITSYKFRSMRYADKGVWAGENENYVTRVGAFLRKTSLDEFPQFLNVLKGELSLVGPRNDIEPLAERLASALPYYNYRYVVRPGITGWAQINQQYEQGNISPQSVEETKVRLAYDFYYIKYRSLGLDIVIALKTVKRMFFRVSSW